MVFGGATRTYLPRACAWSTHASLKTSTLRALRNSKGKGELVRVDHSIFEINWENLLGALLPLMALSSRVFIGAGGCALASVFVAYVGTGFMSYQASKNKGDAEMPLVKDGVCPAGLYSPCGPQCGLCRGSKQKR